MKKNNSVLRIELLLVLLLGACTFFRFTSNKLFIAFLLFIIAVLLGLFIKGDKVVKIDKKKILRVMIVFSVLYLALFYMLGIYSGYMNSEHIFGIKTLFLYIVPIAIIIVSTEYIRKKLLINDTLMSKTLVVIITTLIDVLLYINLFNSKSLEGFLVLIGFITFASISSNMLYTYLCTRYGIKPIIAYKLITILYAYIIPIEPNVYVYFRTFVRMLFPLLIYLYLEKYYNKDKDSLVIKDMRRQIISLTGGIVVIIVVIMLVSCKFYAGVLVIGSDSMVGELNKGDVIFYIADKDKINKNDIIVFTRDDTRIVHRVVNKVNINDQDRYYTKGDANAMIDDFYVVKDNLMGKVLFKIKYIGKPTLWLRKVFDKEG